MFEQVLRVLNPTLDFTLRGAGLGTRRTGRSRLLFGFQQQQKHLMRVAMQRRQPTGDDGTSRAPDQHHILQKAVEARAVALRVTQGRELRARRFEPLLE
jgi:hypothetical protein